VTFSQALGMKRLTKEQLDKAIRHKLSNHNVLCTDAWRSFKTYGCWEGYAHLPVLVWRLNSHQGFLSHLERQQLPPKNERLDTAL